MSFLVDFRSEGRCCDLPSEGKSQHRYFINHSSGPHTENRLEKLIRIWRALHEYVNFVHDPEKQYRSLSACWNPGVTTYIMVYGPIQRREINSEQASDPKKNEARWGLLQGKCRAGVETEAELTVSC